MGAQMKKKHQQLAAQESGCDVFCVIFLFIRIVKLTGWRLLLHDCHCYKLRGIINLTSLH